LTDLEPDNQERITSLAESLNISRKSWDDPDNLSYFAGYYDAYLEFPHTPTGFTSFYAMGYEDGTGDLDIDLENE